MTITLVDFNGTYIFRSRLTQLTLQSNAAIKELKRAHEKV